MIFWVLMRAFHCTAGLLVLAFVPAAAAQPPVQLPRREQPAITEFTVFFKAAPVGTIEVSVEREAEGTVIRGTGRLGPPFALVVRSADIRYDAQWKPVRYALDAAIRDQVVRVTTSFAGGSATSEITEGGKTEKKTDAVALDTLVLPNGFYGAYEALAARLASATAGTELRAYIVPQAEISIKVTGVAEERIEAPGRSVATRHYLLLYLVGEETIQVDLWSDAAARLVRLSVPAQLLDVVRADVATVAARREVAARPGDEAVSISGNGFTLGATVSCPPGSVKSDTMKLPAVVLVGGSGSIDRNEPVVGVPVFAQIAGALGDAGYLVVRYDRRGTGASGGRTESATLSDYADDAVAVVKYVEKRKDVDKKRIAMVAHDDGVWTALLAASRSSRIAALALLGGVGTTGAQQYLDLQERALARMSLSDAERQERVALQRKIQQAVVTGTGWEGIPPEVRKQADTPWFQSFLLFDPAKVMPRTKQPMLFLRGALDTQVSAERHEQLVALARARKGRAGAAVQTDTLAGLNHIFVPATAGEADEQLSFQGRTVGKELLDALTAWLQARFGELAGK
jgi:pimeloyl-ACP methyl ester carboxylesterase